MGPLDLVQLPPLMSHTAGRNEVVIGLIDGPVFREHPDLGESQIRELKNGVAGHCAQAESLACQHGTYVAGILSARRTSAAPGICPACTVLVRPIFAETLSTEDELPSAKPEALADAILDCIRAGVRVINLSAAIAHSSSKHETLLTEVLNEAARRQVIVVTAAGNQGTLGGTALTQHPWVIPVAAFDLQGRPLDISNFGSSISRRGLGAPGDRVTSLSAHGGTRTFGGTSAAAPFVTGTIALLWSLFPAAPAASVKQAITRANHARRTSVIPPLLNAWAAYYALSNWKG